VSTSVPDYFSLFGLEPRFAIDLERLNRAYGQVQAMVHPDRHVRSGAGEKRAAMQLASLANEAFLALKSDTARAAYLCGRHGAGVDQAGAAPLDPSFLEQQMRWREELEEARRESPGQAAAQAGEVATQASVSRAQVLLRVGRLIDEAGDFAGAAVEVRALMFLDKLIAECEQLRAGAAAGSGAQR